MSIDLVELRKLVERATPEPWNTGRSHLGRTIEAHDGGIYIALMGDHCSEGDAALITLAPTLAQRVLDLEAEAERLRAALKGMLDHACVADAAPDDVDEEDRERERAARRALSRANGSRT